MRRLPKPDIERVATAQPGQQDRHCQRRALLARRRRRPSPLVLCGRRAVAPLAESSMDDESRRAWDPGTVARRTGPITVSRPEADSPRLSSATASSRLRMRTARCDGAPGAAYGPGDEHGEADDQALRMSLRHSWTTRTRSGRPSVDRIAIARRVGSRRTSSAMGDAGRRRSAPEAGRHLLGQQSAAVLLRSPMRIGRSRASRMSWLVLIRKISCGIFELAVRIAEMGGRRLGSSSTCGVRRLGPIPLERDRDGMADREILEEGTHRGDRRRRRALNSAL